MASHQHGGACGQHAAMGEGMIWGTEHMGMGVRWSVCVGEC